MVIIITFTLNKRDFSLTKYLYISIYLILRAELLISNLDYLDYLIDYIIVFLLTVTCF
jgi:hypothetical protein